MATITQDTVSILEGYFDEVRDNYSGRGMYGETCLAIVTDESAWDLRGTLEDLRHDYDEADTDLTTILNRAPREDSMGLSRVYYWPSIQVDED